MLKETEKEKLVEQETPPYTPRKKWTCGAGVLCDDPCRRKVFHEGTEAVLSTWSYDPDDWCHPVEFKA